MAAMTAIDEDYSKLDTDLRTVGEKVHLCREMMAANLSLEDGLGEVVGFLEACLKERIPDLIKAGTQGQMSEDLFAKTLACNDAVQRTLEAERNGTAIDVSEGLEGLIGEVEKASLTEGEKEGNNKNNSGSNNNGVDLLDLGGAAMTGQAVSVPVKKKKAVSRVTESFVLAPPSHSSGDDNTFVSPFHTQSSGGNTPNNINININSSSSNSKVEEDDFDKFLAGIDNNK
jgi:hypothetical protein